MTDQEHKQAIQEALGALNTALGAAAEAGLTVEIDYSPFRTMGMREEIRIYEARVTRVQAV